MELIKDLFNNTRVLERFKPNGKKANTERGDLLKEISTKTGYSIPRLAAKLKGMSDTATLYYILSRMNDDVRTGRKSGYQHAFNSALFVPDKI